MAEEQAQQQTPPIEAAQLDANRQIKAAEYARVRRWLMLAELALTFVYVIVWLVSGLSIWWRDEVMLVSTSRWLAVPLFVIGFGLVFSLLTAPMTYYSGFVLPHRYGLSHQRFLDWLWDQAKGTLVSGLLGLVLLELLYWLLAAAPATWWLWAALLMLAVSVLLSNLAPVLIMPLFYKLKPLEDEDLSRRLMELAQRAGTTVRGVFTFDESRKTSTANAALMGLGNTRRIVLADTLVAGYSGDEIETVLAHELGHHVHRDMGLGLGVQTALNLLGFWVAGLVMSWGVRLMGLSGVADPAGFPWLMLALSLYGLITMPAGNAWSRWRERMADRYALAMTGKPAAFASAMTRLANQNLAEAEPPAWVEFLLHSHPSIHKRVAMAEAFRPVTGD